MRSLQFIALTIVLVLTFTAAGEAACLTTDLDNTRWFAYVRFTGGWTRCSINIGSNGAVTAGTTCSSLEDGGATNTESVTGGLLGITSACVVTGRIDTSESGRHTVSHAALDKGRSVLIGVGRDASGETWQLSAVKR